MKRNNTQSHLRNHRPNISVCTRSQVAISNVIYLNYRHIQSYKRLYLRLTYLEQLAEVLSASYSHATSRRVIPLIHSLVYPPPFVRRLARNSLESSPRENRLPSAVHVFYGRPTFATEPYGQLPP